MSRRDVCAAASMDVWAAAVLAFELLRTPGEEAEGQALFGSKEEVGWLDGVCECRLLYYWTIRFYWIVWIVWIVVLLDDLEREVAESRA